MAAPGDLLVVGTAIIADGRLLAARRTAPAPTAGGWELPGGKVDPGETPEQACAREIHEELDCRIEVVDRLPGETRLGPGLVLHVYQARLAGGEPTARDQEHDALRWLGPEDLDDVAWLAPDLPFLATVRERLLDGTRLAGGNVGGAVRVGSTVRRPTGPWTPAVHALLEHLRGTGLDGVPQVLGTDRRDREVLTYLSGRTYDDGRCPDGVLFQTMQWLSRYHRAVRSFRPSGVLRWRFEERAVGPDEIICHHDVAPYNVVVDGTDRLVGVIDWDVAGPGTPLDDLAFCAWNFVPLWQDIGLTETSRRLRLLCNAYGAADPVTVLLGVVPRIAGAVRKIGEGQLAGDPGMLNLATVGEPDRTAAALDALIGRLPTIEEALR